MAMNTYDIRHGPVILKIALNQTEGAQGMVIFDDGESLNTFENSLYTQMNYFWKNLNSTHYSLRLEPVLNGWWNNDEFTSLQALNIYGCTGRPSVMMKINIPTGKTEPIYADTSFSSDRQVCEINFQTGIAMNENSEIFINK